MTLIVLIVLRFVRVYTVWIVIVYPPVMRNELILIF